MDNKKITYTTGDESTLDGIAELWDKLRQLHYEKSRDFKHYYDGFTFAERKKALISQADEGELLVVIASEGSRNIGYCVSGVAKGTGEVKSIFVEEDYRRSDIGGKMMEITLEWIKARSPEKITLEVATGNEEVLGFYAKFGFAPRLIELQWIQPTARTLSALPR